MNSDIQRIKEAINSELPQWISGTIEASYLGCVWVEDKTAIDPTYHLTYIDEPELHIFSAFVSGAGIDFTYEETDPGYFLELADQMSDEVQTCDVCSKTSTAFAEGLEDLPLFFYFEDFGDLCPSCVEELAEAPMEFARMVNGKDDMYKDNLDLEMEWAD